MGKRSLRNGTTRRLSGWIGRVFEEGTIASIAKDLRDDAVSVRANGEGAGEVAAEVDRNHTDAWFHGRFRPFWARCEGQPVIPCIGRARTVEVFDLRTGERIKSIKGFGQPL